MIPQKYWATANADYTHKLHIMSSVTEQIIERLKELRDQIRHYGLIMGGAFIVIEIIQYMMLDHFSIGNSILLFLMKTGILFYVSIWIINKIKPEFFKTGMSYTQSFSLILRLFLYGSLLLGIFCYVLYRWIDPEYLSKLLSNTIEFFRNYINNAGLPDSQLDLIENYIEDFEEQPTPTPLQAMWSQMWSYITSGFFVALIVSIFTRDKNIEQIP